MAISLQADSTLPQGYILVDGQIVASVSTTGGLSATLADNLVTTSALASGSVTTEKIAPGAVVTADLADGAVTAAKMAGGQSGDAPVYGIRAWVNFKGTSPYDVNGGENRCTIRGSGNILKVVRTNTARYTIYFTTYFSNSGYAALAADQASTISNMRFGTNVFTVSAIDVEVFTGSTPGLTIDSDTVMCAFVG